jgi:hypothetical protein
VLYEFGEDFAILGRQVPIKIDNETHHNVRYTFDDEDEKENDDGGVNRHAVLSREVEVSRGSYNQA